MGQNSVRFRCPKKDVKYLKKNTKFSGKEIRERYRIFMMQCPLGKLSAEEFAAQYNIIWHGTDVKEFCRHIHRSFDKDQDGVLDFKEFMQSVHMWTNGTEREKFAWIFDFYDINRNGRLERYEVLQITKATHQALRKQLDLEYDPEKHVEDFFSQMDQDRDGVISREEFLRACNELPSLINLPVPIVHHIAEYKPRKKTRVQDGEDPTDETYFVSYSDSMRNYMKSYQETL